MNSRRSMGPIVGLLFFLSAASPVAGQSPSRPPADPPESSDGEPRAESVSDDAPFGDLLEGLEDLGEANNEAAADQIDAAASDADGVTRRTDSDSTAPPLFQAQRAMGEAARLLASDEFSAPTQSAQQQALDALDRFLQQALAGSAEMTPSDQQASQQQESEQQRSSDADSQEGGEQNPPNEPQETANNEDGMAADQAGGAPEGSVDEVAGPLSRRMEDAVWGHLPERLREQLQATLPEKFLPAYDQAIRDYFTRLSEMADADD